MREYFYENSVVKSLVVAFYTWVIRSLILFLICWGVGRLFGASDIWSAILGAILPVSALGIILSLIPGASSSASEEDMKLSKSLVFFCFGWLVTSIALFMGVDMFCHLGRLPVFFVVLFGGFILFFFFGSMCYTYRSVRGEHSIYLSDYSYDD